MTTRLLSPSEASALMDRIDQQGCSIYSPDVTGALALCLNPRTLDENAGPLETSSNYGRALKDKIDDMWSTERRYNKAATGPTLARLLGETLGVPFVFKKDANADHSEKTQTPIVYHLNTRSADSGYIVAADDSFVRVKGRWRDELLKKLCEWRRRRRDEDFGRNAPSIDEHNSVDLEALQLLFGVPTSSAQYEEVYGTTEIGYDCDGPRYNIIGHQKVRKYISPAELVYIFGNFAHKLSTLPQDAKGHLKWNPHDDYVRPSYCGDGGFAFEMDSIDMHKILFREAARFMAVAKKGP